MDLYDRIDRLEARFAELEPRILAFIPEAGRFERLRREAGQLLVRFPDPDRRPPLFGCFVGVKDIFHVGGFITRAGSRLPPEVLQGPEAEVVTILKAAGALLLGKTVTTEFAYFAPGPTRNPHNLEHTPGGSSSGSAAAVAAGLCSLALGTQTMGSIIRPAAFCGVAGLKPSYYRISRQGVIPLAPSVDHVGLFAPNAAGLIQAAASLYRDWRAEAFAPRTVPSPTSRPVLGIPVGPYLEQASTEALAALERACRRLEDSGYTIRSVEALLDFPQVQIRHQQIVAAEAARVHAAWFREYAHLYAPKTADLIRRGQTVSERDLAAAIVGRLRLRDDLAGLMDRHGIDLWVSPAAPGPAPNGLDSTGDPVMNLPWTYAGMPAINLPAEKNQAGLPMGLQLAGRFYADETLLAWATGIEKVLGWEPLREMP